jgi:hypothetical protein
MHQCQLTGCQSDWVKLHFLAMGPIDCCSMKRKQYSMSDPVPTGSDIECYLRFIERESIGVSGRTRNFTQLD